MASLQQIFGWFSRGLFPTQEQYKQTWSSFWHKSERLPQEQVLGLNDELNKLQQEKASKDDLASATGGLIPMGDALDIADLNTKPKRPNDSYFVLNQLDENGDAYIFRYDAGLGEWINTKQVVYKDVAKKEDVAQLEQDIEPFSVLDVMGVGTFTPFDIAFTQGAYYNQQGILTPNSYWEYAIIPINEGICTFSNLSIGDGTVSPLILRQGDNIVKIFKNNISGINVRLKLPIDSIIVSRAIGYAGTAGSYLRYVDKNKLTDNEQKVNIFRDADTPEFYRNVMLDLKINGVQVSDVLWLSTLYNKDTANQINISKTGVGVVCNFYADKKGTGIKEIIIPEFNNSGYSAIATINYDLLYNATLPAPLYPAFNTNVVRYDSAIKTKTTLLNKKISEFPFIKNVLSLNERLLNIDSIEGLYLRTIDGSPIPIENFYFSKFARGNSTTQITVSMKAANGLETIVANFWVGSALFGTQVLKLSEYQNSNIEGYIRVNFDKINSNFDYQDKYDYLDKERVFNPQLFYDVYNSIAALSSGLIGKNGKTLLAIGDSLTAIKEWQKKIVEMLGMTVRTHAKGGAGIIQMIDGYPPELLPLSVADVTGVDVITLYGGYNNRNIEYGQIGDIYPTNNTITGMIQYAINRIYELLKQANNMQCKIVIITPHCGGKYDWSDVDGYTEYPAGTGRTLEGMANAIKTIANYNSLPCIDLWHNSGINKFTWDTFQNSPVAEYPQYIGRFATTDELPRPANNGDRAKVDTYSGSYRYNGADWNTNEAPYPWNADQLHCNALGYAKIGEYIARCINAL